MSPSQLYIERGRRGWVYSLNARGCASSSSNMRIKALVIFFTAMICQSTALREPFTVMDAPEHTGTPDFKPEKLHPFLLMDRRESEEPNVSDDSGLCLFIHEKDESSHISCKHRLTRSKFNYNPFGLRFGKRNDATARDTDKPKHLLPIMLYLKQLETS
ncbi:kisspeptin 2 isoform X2 [Triplophysa dalaica]|uniref:kisspeptin 2 isoform X2 n=1 Tax=Triplophysa dalaica TaxID=1582913 RepID=UPI0024E039BC|nr:kisspeptin 2 isoform X2 [Triplophysa dalaica]